MQSLILFTMYRFVIPIITNRHQITSNNCSVCKQPLLTSEYKVNVTLNDILKDKYPKEMKERKVEVEEKKARTNIGERNKSKYFYLRRGDLHLIPNQATTIVLKVKEYQQYEVISKIANKAVLLTDLKDDKGGYYGSWFDLGSAKYIMDRLVLVGKGRIIATKLTTVYFEEYDQNVDMCEIQEISDKTPAEENKQNELIHEGKLVYDMLQDILTRTDEVLLNQVKRKRIIEPHYNENANNQGKLAFSVAASLYIACVIGASEKYPFIFYTTDPLQRLNWCKRLMMDTENTADLFVKKGMVKEVIQFIVIIIVVIIILFILKR